MRRKRKGNDIWRRSPGKAYEGDQYMCWKKETMWHDEGGTAYRLNNNIKLNQPSLV